MSRLNQVDVLFPKPEHSQVATEMDEKEGIKSDESQDKTRLGRLGRGPGLGWRGRSQWPRMGMSDNIADCNIVYEKLGCYISSLYRTYGETRPLFEYS
ncbi:hypothetical protein VTK26DRAFT_8905 [Humicola hyalothermophila]